MEDLNALNKENEIEVYSMMPEDEEEVIYEIELEDGTTLSDLRMNGNNFIASYEIDPEIFNDNLGSVIFSTSKSKTRTYENMALVQIKKVGDDTWFILRELSTTEIKYQTLNEKVEDMAENGTGGGGGGNATGIPPRNMSNFRVEGGNGFCRIAGRTPGNTTIEGQLVCTVAGVLIRRKKGSAPKDQTDGVEVADIKGNLTDFSIVDDTVQNGSEYYYRFFPYSDHNVYNLNSSNILKAVPIEPTFWAFRQDFTNLDPDSTITYPEGYANESFVPMMTNAENGTMTAGSWLPFLQDTLKNYPFAVKDAVDDGMLDQNDYRVKYDGTPSYLGNTSYEGGWFAWINRIYMRETYAEDGNSRLVEFSNIENEGFEPIGFYHPNGGVMEGVWIPMGYLSLGGGVSIGDGSDPNYVNGDTNGAVQRNGGVLINTIETKMRQKLGDKAYFFGGPILNVLRDLMYMMFKSTNIQEKAGYGYGGLVTLNPSNTYWCMCYYSDQAAPGRDIVFNKDIPGWYGGTSASYTNVDRCFHSLVMGNYMFYIYDPYFFYNNTSNGYRLLVNKDYSIGSARTFDPIYDNANYEYSGIDFPALFSNYPSKMKLIEGYGSVPLDDNSGSDTTGLCDMYALTNNTGGNWVYSTMLGEMTASYYSYRGQIGISHIRTYPSSELANNSYLSEAPMYLPDPGYKPDFEYYESYFKLQEMNEEVDDLEGIKEQFLTAQNGVNFRFGVTDDEQYGYILTENDQDVTHPFDPK